jgi:hypothetical protein
MKLSRHLLVIFPFTAACALAQTLGGSTAAVVSQTVVPVASTTPPTGLVIPVDPTLNVFPSAPPSDLPSPTLRPVGAVELPQSSGETTLTLDVNFGIRYVPPSRVTVPSGERLTISAPAMSGPLQWRKNGRAIAGATDTRLTFASVQSSDAGTYDAIYTDPVMAGRGTQALVLGVGPTDRLLNLSTRAVIGGSGDSTLVSGFVVAGAQGKKLILRAVGPSLSLFNVANPLRAPVLRIFDSAGKPYTNGYAYPAVVGGPTYETDLADSLLRVGAFPIPKDTRDAVVMMPFVPGSYTAQVTSGDGTSGAVLLEIYEVP